MVTIHQSYMVVECNRSYIDLLFFHDPEKCLEGIIQLKNSVIGSNNQKATVIRMGLVPRLLQILREESHPQLLCETAVILNSLAKGTEENVKALLDAGVLPVLLQGLVHQDQRYVEACLCCLRTLFRSELTPVECMYEDPWAVRHLILMATQTHASNQECIATILTAVCKTPDHQNYLCAHGAVPALTALLCSPMYKVQLPSLRCLTHMCYQNLKVSQALVVSSYGGRTVPDILVTLMARDKPTEMQLAAAKCMTFLSRTGAVHSEDPRIVFKALPTLVRMCKKERTPEERAHGAETLAYLAEVDTELQRIASISDHLIPTLAELLKYQPPSAVVLYKGPVPAVTMKKLEQEVKVMQELRQAAFKAFAALGANDEDIRKKIIETDSLMEHVVSSLSDTNPRVRLAAVRCLHSLSRSVQQLRTTFQDHAVWRPLMRLLHNAPDDILLVASSTLCNLLLEFSPSKEHCAHLQPILECGAVELLCGLTRRDEPALRLNGVWALMNMAFQADQKIKSQILSTLGTDQVFRLLSDPDVSVLMKTLGLLRNLLSIKQHIDHIMDSHGTQIMQAVILILEGDHSADVKEQALCILANIADGDTAKAFIMANEDVLKKLTTYIAHSNVKLQIAATFCISNLVWSEEEGARERQSKLRELGVQKLLQSLLITSDTTLFDKVKTALQQFS
ncbi:armadillo repeat-containing protein 8 isoform X4 [Rhipicephalus sanguineus]|uniref:armadillo repeat-containing protein 8 isoform X4 n=1 Tax=Rhipicephalus sanguineus TaxID=34632 RepID=UPI00189614AB|nr:armadillo repeat-containing protein 8 isoform X4 [Rhipicephalus sanguineus]